MHCDRFDLLREELALAHVPPQLLAQAFCHPSFAREQGMEESDSNQRLEFLGDAVLDLVLADYLYRTRPELTEGELTRLKAALVRQSALAAVARELGLGECLLLGRGEESTGGRQKTSLLADAVEALIGAVFLSAGWDAARDFVIRHFARLLRETERRGNLSDAKSRLQELVQGRGAAPPEYVVTRTDGPPHERVFHVQVRFAGKTIGSGCGSSKRQAEQEAAAAALEHIEEWFEA